LNSTSYEEEDALQEYFKMEWDRWKRDWPVENLCTIITEFINDRSSDVVREDRFKHELFQRMGQRFDGISKENAAANRSLASRAQVDDVTEKVELLSELVVSLSSQLDQLRKSPAESHSEMESSSLSPDEPAAESQTITAPSISDAQKQAGRIKARRRIHKGDQSVLDQANSSGEQVLL